MEVVYDLATVEFPTGGLKTKNGDIVRCQRGLIVHESFQDSKVYTLPQSHEVYF